MRKLIAVALVAGIVSACATDKTLVPIGGSRADGVVELAFEYGMFQKPKIDEQAALASAKERCHAWGYSNAEPFGGAMQTCTAVNGYGCMRTRVSVKYQCTGAHTPS